MKLFLRYDCNVMLSKAMETVVSANRNTNFSFSHRACSGPETKAFLIFGHPFENSRGKSRFIKD